MDLSSLPAPLRTLLDAPQDWMEDGEKVSGELILRSDGTCIGAGRKKGAWSFPNAVTGALIVEARSPPLPPKHRSRPSRAGSSGLRRFHFHRSPPLHLSCGLLTSRPPNGMYSAERLPWSIASGAKFVELLGGGD